MKRVGVGLEDGSSHRIADVVWRVLGLDGKLVTGSQADQFALLRSGDLDGLFLLANEGDVTIAGELGGGGLTLRAFDEWSQSAGPLSFPFLRPVTIADETYPFQAEPVESIGVQIVLLGQAESIGALDGRGGPVTTEQLRTAMPIEPAKIVMLNEILTSLRGSSEVLNPTLPVADALKRQIKLQVTEFDHKLDVSIANLLFFCLVIVLVYLLRTKRQTGKGAEKQ